MQTSNRFLTAAVAAGAVMALSATALATPYASGIQLNGASSSFILNEGGATVDVVYDGGASTVNLGTLAAGTHTFDATLGSTWEIVAASSTAAGWTQISDDNLTQSQYYSPRGVAVNQNPGSSNFGRIYVSNQLAGTQTDIGDRFTSEGLYVLGADQSDIESQGDTAADGLVDWFTYSNSPFRLTVAPDDSVYIADWSDGHSGVWRSPADLSGTWANVLNNDFRDETTGLTGNHGSIPAVWVEGTGADTRLYTLDEDFDWGGSTGSILRYDIGTATDYDGFPTEQTQDGTNIILNLRADLVRDEDGSWWVTQYRWSETPAAPSLVRFEDGGAEPVYVSASDDNLPTLTQNYGSVDIHNELDMLVMGTVTNAGVYVLDISDPDNPVLLETIAQSGNVHDVGFDAAGNIYAVNNATETLRIFSPGGDWIATTTSDGTFAIMEGVGPVYDEADFNRDGAVDGDDFLLWQGGFGTSSGADKMDGDYDNDGDVDGDDFLGWQAEFGNGDGLGSTAVPEPASVLLLLAAALGLWACRRR